MRIEANQHIADLSDLTSLEAWNHKVLVACGHKPLAMSLATCIGLESTGGTNQNFKNSGDHFCCILRLNIIHGNATSQISNTGWFCERRSRCPAFSALEDGTINRETTIVSHIFGRCTNFRKLKGIMMWSDFLTWCKEVGSQLLRALCELQWPLHKFLLCRVQAYLKTRVT